MAAGSIIVDLLMRTGAFETDTKRAEAALKKFQKQAVDAAKVAGQAIGAFAGGMAVLVQQTVQANAEMQRFAALSNTSTSTFQALATGAKTVGIEADKMADIFKDVQDKVGDFMQTGGGAMADFFENIAPQVGVTAEQFRRLSGPEALQLYVDSLEKANLSQSDMIFYMEAIASDASLLLPLLKNGGEGFREYADMAQRFGVILEDDALAAMNDFKRANDITQLAMRGFANQVTQAIVPAFMNMVNVFSNADTGARNLSAAAQIAANGMKILLSTGAMVAGAFKTIGEYFGGLAAVWANIFAGRFKQAYETYKDVNLDFVGNTRQTVDAMKSIWSEYTPTAGAIPAPVMPGRLSAARGTTGGGSTQSLQEENSAAKMYAETMRDLTNQIQQLDIASQGLTGTQAKLELLFSSADFKAMPETWQQAVREQANLLLQQEELNRQISSAARLTEDMRSEYERASTEVADLVRLFDLNLISAETLQRRLNQIAEQSLPKAGAEAERLAAELAAAGASAESISQGMAGAQVAAASSLDEAIKDMKMLMDAYDDLRRAMVESRKESGFFTDMEALRAESKVNQQRIADLRAYQDALRDYAETTGGWTAKMEAEFIRTEAQIERLLAKVDLVANKIREVFEDAFASGFEDILNGTKSFGEAFKSIFNDIFREMNRMVARELSQGFMRFLGGGLFPGESQGLFSFIGNIFAPQSGPDFFGARAGGGDVLGGRAYLVGESGPEMFVPRTAGMVIPNMALAGGGGSMSIVNNFTVSGSVDKRTQLQIAREANMALQRGQRNM